MKTYRRLEEDRFRMSRLRPIHLTTAVLVGAYLMTTGLGAALFTSRFGREQLAAHLYPQPVPFEWMMTLGSPQYWALLLSMIVVAPVAAFASERVTTRLATSIQFPDIPTWIPIAVAGFMSAFCIYKLAMAGGLSAREAWDSSVCYDAKILRRVALMEQLGNRFYCFVYSGLPMIGCYLLAQGIKKKDVLAYVGCAVVSAMILWFDVAIVTKGYAVIYVLTLGLTLTLCGFGIVRSLAVTIPVAVGLYAALSVMQFCSSQTASWEVVVPPPTLTPPASALKTTSAAPGTGKSPIVVVPPVSQPPQHANDKSVPAQIGYMARAALFRMAAGFPYYVQTFSEPDQRCGIDHPPLRWLPQKSCFSPIKIFSAMYPSITYVTGFQPAPVNVSAYAEAGPWYALAATIACGLIIGALSAFASGNSQLSISLIVACCIYAYYASQTSLTGSLLDSYGLIWLLFPIVLMMGIAALWRIVNAAHTADPSVHAGINPTRVKD